MDLAQILAAAGSSNAPAKTYIEDVFSAQLYTGAGSSQSVVNGVNLEAGGMLWIKSRNAAYDHILADSSRSLRSTLRTNTNEAALTNISTTGITSFKAMASV